jgi:pSer/pThr/pTyr-binding forkhead associated (FHA) protein
MAPDWRIRALDRDGREVASCDLGAGELTIGRDGDRQMVLASASISRRHARLVSSGGELQIVDDGSANGVVVDGARIAGPSPIGPESRIELADFRIAVERLQPLEAARSRLTLVAEGGPYDGRVFGLTEGEMHLGRAVDNELVFDDPSLSRRHARLRCQGARVELEDLGSSNGTFVNGRRISSGSAGAGDLVRFGDLVFRCEGAEQGSTRNVEAVLSRGQLYALSTGGMVTIVLLCAAAFVLIRKLPPVQASGREALTRIDQQAQAHLQNGRRLYQERKYGDAKTELDQAIELDPANLEMRRLSALTGHGADDDRALTVGSAAAALGDRKGLESALKSLGEMSAGAPQRAQLAAKLEPQLERFGGAACARRDFQTCSWALCLACDNVAPGAHVDPQAAAQLKEAEHTLARDRSHQPCRCVP